MDQLISLRQLDLVTDNNKKIESAELWTLPFWLIPEKKTVRMRNKYVDLVRELKIPKSYRA